MTDEAPAARKAAELFLEMDRLSLIEKVRALKAELASVKRDWLELAKIEARKSARAEKAEAELNRTRENCSAWKKNAAEWQLRVEKAEAEVERLETENNTLKINILEAGLTPPGWVRLAGVERESDEEARR